jgi:peroxiredoxin
VLPPVEIGCAVALIPVSLAWWGAAAVLVLLVLFSAAIAINIASGRRPDCHCFGQLHSAPVGWNTLGRNILLGALAGSILWQGPGAAVANIRAWALGLNRLEAAILALAVACAALGAFMAWALFHLLRQNGRLLLRLEAIEAKVGVNPNVLPASAGLPLNSPAPEFSLPALEGGIVALENLTQRSLPVLLIFTEPDCGACESLLPDIAQWQQQYAERVTIVLISGGGEEANRAKNGKHGLRSTLLQKDREVSEAYKVVGNPSAVLIIGGRVANELAVGPDPIRGLVARLVLPRVGKGDTVPSVRLRDLDGKIVDLAEMRGRRTLLTFWNPSCGFCQNMLADLKKWEQTPLNGGPGLLVVSSRSVEENRQQGFRAPVLLDPALSAMHVFGASGTPSAVMFDEEGRVASGVEVGADAVLALAGVVRVVAR